MRPDGPTSWLLDGRTGWRTAYEDGAVAAGLAGIRLAPRADGPLSLGSEGGTLGALRLPLVLAVADGDVDLLSRSRRQVLRYRPAAGDFEALPTLGGDEHGARSLRDPAAVAATGDVLYVADHGARRVLVLSRKSLVLRAVWGPWDADGCDVRADAPTAWEPVALAAAGGYAFLLDRAHGRVWRHHPAHGRLVLAIDRAEARGRWTNLAIDTGGRIYLHDAAAGTLDVFAADGVPQGQVSDPGEVRERFDAPPMLLEGGRFCVPESLGRPCDRRPPEVPPRPEAPLAACAAGGTGRAFDLSGGSVAIDPAARGPRPWATEGTWISAALDSDIPGCQWHRIALELGRLPAGSSIEVRTYADDRERSPGELRALAEDLWETRHVLTGAMQPGQAEPVADELLVQSRPGRYLWLRVTLRSDGFATPAIAGIRVHYPRASYLEYLPEAFAAEDETRWFLERFLSIAQTEWDEIEQRGADMPAYFDPEAVPPGSALGLLAGWLALPLEGGWSADAKRHLLAGVPRVYARRGTLDEVRGFLRLYLESIRGAELGGAEYPCLVEGFRERAHLMLSAGRAAAVEPGAPLWSRSVVGRLQLGVFSRAGGARLVSTGDPQRDLFHEYAHRFRVFIPADWVRTAEEERMVRRALDAEKPAHTRYDLCLVEPRLRVGVQCTVGVDTIVAGYPELRLPCDPPADLPQSLGPRGRLGYDTVLAGRPEAGLRLGTDQRIGTTPPLI